MTDHHHDNLPVAEQEPIRDPGLPAHHPRPTDVDPKAARRAERQVAVMFLASMVFAVLFAVAYYSIDGTGSATPTVAGLGAMNVALGVSLGLALLLIGVGIVHWARKLMGDHEISELRHPAASSEEDREATLVALKQGLEESGIGRRPLVRNSLLGALGFLGVPAVVAMTDLGPTATPSTIRKTLARTVWKQGTRIVNDGNGRYIRVSDMEVGQLVNANPEGLIEARDPRATEEHLQEVDDQFLHAPELINEKAKAAVILVRMEPKDITEETANWGVEGIVAYSKICTHVGCPIALYEQQTHHLLCPCHQSTFDLADKARVIFGPAARPLPQLRIRVEEETGYLIADGDFEEPVGPSYWERG